MAAGNDVNNLSSRFRSKRFKIFQNLLREKNITNPRILDVGGTEEYWNQMNLICDTNYHPIIINISKEQIQAGKFNAIIDDAKSLSSVKNNSFDIAYSNSVIEHLPTYEEQQEMAKNLKRIARYYFVQTPAFIFPFEPHFHFLFFHWLPRKVRIFLVSKFSLGWFERASSIEEAERLIDSIRILKKKELKLIFKNAKIITESYFLVPKSFMVVNLHS